jgi:endothelin-converting enzyme/putative endopeptidase
LKRNILFLFLIASAAFSQGTGFNVANIDRSADPCTNFYQYACGTWMKNNPLPSDQSRWARFNELQERNYTILKDILETSSHKQNRSAVEQKIGDYYQSCMDEKSIEAKGTAPLKAELERIAGLKDKNALADQLVRLHRMGAGPLFSFYSRQDNKDSTRIIAQADQGGLSLPDRDYYLKEDPKSAELRKAYVAHVQQMFELAGRSKEDAAAAAKAVMEIETTLAKISMDRVARRNPNNTYHLSSAKELAGLTPAFDWNSYIAEIGAPKFDAVNIVNPEFFKGLETLLKSTDLGDLKTYLAWKYIHVASPMLPAAFVNADFEFFGRTLTGTKELRPRWKRCVSAVDSDLGEALGQKYVELTFGTNAKARMAELIKNVEGALEKNIQTLEWMTPATKKRALEKLHAFGNKVGHPERWREYAKLDIKRGDALGNSLRSNTFAYQWILDKIGKEPDPKEWVMSPPTVNAYYSPQQNNINFPAGILQPPFFDAKLDDAVNYGAIGAVIGHEIIHGFDDSGRRFDGQGNMRDWWTADDAKEYERRAGCIDHQYSGYTAVADVKLNGKLTLGENVADNGGLRIAYMALMDALEGKSKEKIDGFTPEQRLFLGFGQVWCQNITPEAARMRAVTDPHSSGEWRANGTVSNMPEFWKAFGCKPGQPMVRGENACRVW